MLKGKTISPRNENIQSQQEEKANAITHGLGVLLSFALVPMLIAKAAMHDAILMLLASAVFSFGIVLCYLSSTLYHFVQKPRLKERLRIWDHISIFLLIAGTYTPIICKYTDSKVAIMFLSLMWGIVIIGRLFKIFFTGKYDHLSTALYLMLGWMAVFVIKPLKTNMPMDIFLWILGGGVSYRFGIIFYKWHRLKFQHSIWHLFVLAGTLLQFVGVYKCIGQPITIK